MASILEGSALYKSLNKHLQAMIKNFIFITLLRKDESKGSIASY